MGYGFNADHPSYRDQFRRQRCNSDGMVGQLAASVTVSFLLFHQPHMYIHLLRARMEQLCYYPQRSASHIADRPSEVDALPSIAAKVGDATHDHVRRPALAFVTITIPRTSRDQDTGRQATSRVNLCVWVLRPQPSCLHSGLLRDGYRNWSTVNAQHRRATAASTPLELGDQRCLSSST